MVVVRSLPEEINAAALPLPAPNDASVKGAIKLIMWPYAYASRYDSSYDEGLVFDPMGDIQLIFRELHTLGIAR